MKIAGLAHFSMPWRNCGSEVVISELMAAAARAGHDVRVWCTHKDAERNWHGREPDIEFEGYRIHRSRNVILAGNELTQWKPDVIVSHHDHAAYAIRQAKRIGARSVYLVHNDMDINHSPMRLKPNLIIHNSDWVRESLKRFPQPKKDFVFHPPLTADRHLVESTGDHLTLINLNSDKGAHVFYELAKRMPDRKFLGVVGGHGKQVIQRGLPNVTIMDHGPDMKRVWSSTRILLMPSIYESYGLTAVEAGINGIPTIANPTPGLMENLGELGLFAERDELTDWYSEIRKLDHPNHYQTCSDYARSRSELALSDTQKALTRWTDWIDGV